MYLIKPMLFTLISIPCMLSSLLFGQKPLLNLDDFIQNFILESKEIILEDFPYAFNPSITRWEGGFLMCFRIRDPITSSTYRIGLVKLNENFDVVGKPYELLMPVINPDAAVREQDPRLITIGKKLFMVYSNSIPAVSLTATRRMFIAEILFEDNQFLLGTIEGPLGFQGESEMRWEKNWAPFVYNGELLLSYSINPHRVLQPIPGKNFCELVATSEASISWDFGALRGGTQAYLDGDKYLAFFHSSTNLATVQSNGVKFTHYFMGAYTFSNEPPFEITHMSPKPIIGKDYYSGPPYKTWKPLRVVFPGGILFDEQYIYVMCGKQDHEIWIYKFDKKGLLDSLVPVKRK